MKTLTPLFIISAALLSALLFFGACSTRNVSMQLLVPAEISIPKDVQSIGILNRSLPDQESKLINVLEGFVTGESVLADREGSFHCIRGVGARLAESPRLKAVVIETDRFRGTGTRQFPEPLSWASVDELCKEYQVDAILALETFDSDFEIRKHTSDVKEKVNGREVTRKEHHADLRVNIGSGWRLYSGINRSILDQVTFSDRKDWSGSGRSEQAALDDLPDKRRAINESGSFAGRLLANRISPNWRTESRSYFVKGHDELKIAKHEVKFNNWDAAIVIWKRLAAGSDPEVAGKACYNLALASEMEGNLDIAIVWIEKSMKEFHVKKARQYAETLYRRRENEIRLKEQMNE